MTIAEKPQGYTQLYKRHISAHMCTIENTEKLCKGTLEACSVVMAPSVMSCGRGAWVSTMRGGTQKKRAGHEGPDVDITEVDNAQPIQMWR